MSDKETIEWLRDENADLKVRLRESRKHATDVIDTNDRLRRELKRRRDLLGPGYRYTFVCSDGRAWGRPAESAREETIRWFAGQALSRTASAVEAIDTAFGLWDLLEDHFADEREQRKAAEAEAEAKENEAVEGESCQD